MADLRARLFAPARAPLWSALLAILASLVVCFLAILATGKDPLAGYGWLAEGAFGGLRPLGETGLKSRRLLPGYRGPGGGGRTGSGWRR